MKNIKIFSLIVFLVATVKMPAQEVFVLDGETLKLKQEVKGPMNLFWVLQGYDYRYFVQKGNKMLELKNTTIQGEPQEEYKNQLQNLAGNVEISTAHVDFVLYDLRFFVNRFNAKVNKDYEFNASTPNFQKRIGFFVGLSNNKYTHNPQNILAPVIGLEFEVYDPNLLPGHSVFLQFRQSFEQDEYQYSSTQLSLNYRLKFLNFRNFNLHLNAELATFLYSQNRKAITGADGNIVGYRDDNGFTFTSPLSFGIGGDIKITDESFITFSYNDIVSIVLDGNGSFPLDFSLGYKYNL
ncbi:MAG TPA: hypothetical protein VFI78_00855 [Salinimicrobium sp.]|nr:hypothetical protein [Salinimicrobium sp.]